MRDDLESLQKEALENELDHFEKKLYLLSRYHETNNLYINLMNRTGVTPETYELLMKKISYKKELRNFYFYKAYFKVEDQYFYGQESLYIDQSLENLGNLDMDNYSKIKTAGIKSISLDSSTVIGKYRAKMISRNHGKLKLLWEKDQTIPKFISFP